jgi:hypothetical protein
MKWDTFISHASEDKDEVAKPLAEELQRRGLQVWYDEYSLRVGDSLRRKIDEGLAQSRFGIVILSPNFFAKEWPRRELDGLVAKEIGGQKVILPIWHNVSRADVEGFSPVLADRLGIPTTRGLEVIIEELVSVIRPPSTGVISHPPSEPNTAATLMAMGESKLKQGAHAQAEEALNALLRQFPQSREALTTRKLISFLREAEGTTAAIDSIRPGEAARVAKLFESLDSIVGGYSNIDRSKQEALEQIFGTEMFRRRS